MTTSTDDCESSANQAVAEAIQAALPEGRVVVDRDVVRGLSQDQAAWAPVGAARRGSACPQHRRSAQGCRGVSATRCVGRSARRRNRTLGWRERDRRMCRAIAGGDGGHRPDRPARAVGRRPARGRQRRSARSSRGARPVVSAGSGQFAVVHHRGQRGDERGRCLLREVRRDP